MQTKAKKGDVIAVHTASIGYSMLAGTFHINRLELARAEGVGRDGVVKTFTKGNTAFGRVDKTVAKVYTMPADKMRVEDFWNAHKDTIFDTLGAIRDAARPFRTDLGTTESLGA